MKFIKPYKNYSIFINDIILVNNLLWIMSGSLNDGKTKLR